MVEVSCHTVTQEVFLLQFYLSRYVFLTTPITDTFYLPSPPSDPSRSDGLHSV